MKQKFKNPIFVFAFGVILTSAIFFLFPINLFDGEIVFEIGMKTWKEKANISLSYFFGIGAEKEQLEQLGVKDFYLLPRGICDPDLFRNRASRSELELLLVPGGLAGALGGRREPTMLPFFKH